MALDIRASPEKVAFSDIHIGVVYQCEVRSGAKERISLLSGMALPNTDIAAKSRAELPQLDVGQVEVRFAMLTRYRDTPSYSIIGCLRLCFPKAWIVSPRGRGRYAQVQYLCANSRIRLKVSRGFGLALVCACKSTRPPLRKKVMPVHFCGLIVFISLDGRSYISLEIFWKP